MISDPTGNFDSKSRPYIHLALKLVLLLTACI